MDAPNTIEISLPVPLDTERLATLLAGCLPRELCVWLSGQPGAGKTHFARALLRALGWTRAVRSPTYTLLETYEMDGMQQKLEAESRFLLYHADLYRMASPEEWADAGFDDLPGPAVRLIEWPERGGSQVAKPDLHLTLDVLGSGRRARLAPLTKIGGETCQKLVSALQQAPSGSALRWSRVC